MRLPEQRLWDRIDRNLGPLVHLERIENVAGVGYPDAEAIHESIVTKIELKAVEKPPKRWDTPLLGDAKGLSWNQRNWWMRYLKAGGRGVFIIGVGKGVFARQLMLDAKHFDEVNFMNLDRLRSLAIATGWRAMAEHLQGVSKQ